MRHISPLALTRLCRMCGLTHATLSTMKPLVQASLQVRIEQRRKERPASIELTRKEQQKVLQEKQKSRANKQQSDEFTDMLLEEAKEEGLSEAGECASKEISGSSLQRMKL
ncbi:hypothetical protein CTI12_AA283650 [Artemisia annua]|uniref:Uncharacterized protein n=1 Tax=Artemisia annua TaxID=35608 RepID=A0A2U1NBJ3_ARTAN|nr:hypothetical protein CTI12_AA283650 [Artemisia annua]